jgi:hypothetical protein
LLAATEIPKGLVKNGIISVTSDDNIWLLIPETNNEFAKKYNIEFINVIAGQSDENGVIVNGVAVNSEFLADIERCMKKLSIESRFVVNERSGGMCVYHCSLKLKFLPYYCVFCKIKNESGKFMSVQVCFTAVNIEMCNTVQQQLACIEGAMMVF